MGNVSEKMLKELAANVEAHRLDVHPLYNKCCAWTRKYGPAFAEAIATARAAGYARGLEDAAKALEECGGYSVDPDWARCAAEIVRALPAVSKEAAFLMDLDNYSPDIGDILEECEGYFDKQADMIDGTDSRPVPNHALWLRDRVRAALAARARLIRALAAQEAGKEEGE